MFSWVFFPNNEDALNNIMRISSKLKWTFSKNEYSCSCHGNQWMCNAIQRNYFIIYLSTKDKNKYLQMQYFFQHCDRGDNLSDTNIETINRRDNLSDNNSETINRGDNL